MLKNNIKSKFIKSLLDKKILQHRKGSNDLQEKIFPIKNEFYKFLQISKQEQLEMVKDLYCDISFSTFASPPNVLLRNLIRLQTKERSVKKSNNYVPRDHVIHSIYIYILGLYLYENSSFFRTKVNKKFSLLKRKYSLNNKDNNEIFIELWKQFALFHDIGYPIERLSDDQISPFILENLIPSVNNIKDEYVDDYILRIISNIIAIVTVTSRKEKLDFKNQVFQYLHKNAQEEFKAYFEPDVFNILLKSKPYIHLNSIKQAKMVSVLIGDENLICVVEDILNGEIVFISTLDRQKVLFLSKKTNSNSLYKTFFEKESLPDTYLMKFYNLKSDYSATNALKNKFGATFIDDIMSVHERISIKNIYQKSYHSDNSSSSNILNYIVYSVITTDMFISHSSRNRIQERDTLEIIENTLHNIDFLEIITEGLKSIVEDRISKQDLNILEIFETERQSEIYSKAISSTFQLDKIWEDIVEALKKRSESDTQNKYENINNLISDFRDDYSKIVDNIPLYKRLTQNLREIIQPTIEKEILASNAISGIFSKIKPMVEDILSSSLEKCTIFNRMKDCDFNNVKKVRDLISDSIDSILLVKVSDDEKNFYKDLAKNYNPAWKIDHGFISSLIYLGNLELLYYLTTDISEDLKYADDFYLIKLFFDDRDKLNDESMKGELLLSAEICFRSIFLHNFYPSKTINHKDFSHDINQNAFTYYSIFCDLLQDWGREIQYDSGVKDIKKFKPDSFLDIQILENKIKVKYNRDYFDESELISHKEQLASYLMDINTYIDFELE